MGKLFFVVMIVVAVFFGIVAFATSRPSNTNTFDSLTPSPAKNTSQQQAQQQTQQQTQTQATQPTQPALLFPTDAWVTTATQAAIHTVKGDITIQLYPQDAPKTVTNFATLATKGYYNGLTFHRVEPGFVIQGGDPNGNGTGGYSIYGPTFQDELNPNTPSYQAGYLKGVVAMANRGPNTNGSQFFIMLQDNTTLPKNYTIFGKVTSGMDVVQKIAVGDKMTKIDIQ